MSVLKLKIVVENLHTSLLVPLNRFSNESTIRACLSKLVIYCEMSPRVSSSSSTCCPILAISCIHDLAMSALDIRIKEAFNNFRLIISRVCVSLNVTA